LGEYLGGGGGKSPLWSHLGFLSWGGGAVHCKVKRLQPTIKKKKKKKKGILRQAGGAAKREEKKNRKRSACRGKVLQVRTERLRSSRKKGKAQNRKTGREGGGRGSNTKTTTERKKNREKKNSRTVINQFQVGNLGTYIHRKNGGGRQNWFGRGKRVWGGCSVPQKVWGSRIFVRQGEKGGEGKNSK